MPYTTLLVIDVAVSPGYGKLFYSPEKEQSDESMCQLVSEVHKPVKVMTDFGRYEKEHKNRICCKSAE